MPRRGENIYKRKDGRWEGRCIVFYGPDGKARYKSVYGQDYKEVKSKLKAVMQGTEETAFVPAHKKNVERVCLEWLESVRISVKASSFARYHNMIYSHIVPYFKNTLISRLNIDMLNDFIKEMSMNGNPKKKAGLALKTIRDISTMMGQIVKYAEKRDYISNFRYDVTLPSEKFEPLEVLEPPEQAKLVRYIIENTSNENLGVLIALYTGIRIGELCALTWGDIDLETANLKITKTIQRIQNVNHSPGAKTRVIISSPKSKKSIRNIPIPTVLLVRLKAKAGNYSAQDYFLTGRKKPVEPRVYQRKYERCLQEAGVTYLNFHSLRHTFATRAIETGFDIKSLSEILGHASVNFTLDKYVHSLNQQKRDCMEKLPTYC